MDRRTAVRAWALLGALVAGPGCDERDPVVPIAAPPKAPTHFDAARAGTVRGHVTWVGNIPFVTKLDGCSNPVTENGPRERVVVPNPNEPRIDPKTKRVANAVVFLRGVDPAVARQWDHPPVRVLQRQYRFHVLQGTSDSSVGFVRAGDEIEMESADGCLHAIHAEGAAWFSLTFPDPHEPLRRALKHPGLVELTSAAGYYWMRAYVFVDQHPYYALTDAEGQFLIDQIPAGDYELVCWMPSWQEKRHERDPESSLYVRLSFRAPIEISHPVTVHAGTTTQAAFQVSPELFNRKSFPVTCFESSSGRATTPSQARCHR
jgi:hypothetical protein